MERTSAVPTIWAKCFALTTQKFNKGRTKPNLSPNGDRVGIQVSFGPRSRTGILWRDRLERH